jgi:mannose-1-phosphate guanylyltransferase
MIDKDILDEVEKMGKDTDKTVNLLLRRALKMNVPQQAVFMLGGEGTRFRPITYELPKALLPVQGKTVPEHLFDLFKRFGITDYIFSVGYKAERLKHHYGTGERWGVNITYVIEDKPLGSGGAIRLAKDHIKGPFIVTNGDELKDIDLEEMYAEHKRNKAKATVALTKVDNPEHYGVADMEGNRIKKFVEKPAKGTEPSNLIHAGLSIWEREVIEMIPEGFCSYEKEIFPKLAEQGRLAGYPFKGQWFDTGTPERYEKAIKEWKGLRKI